MDQRIKFRHLQTFLEVARQRSVGKAADALAITQPAVTRTIRELEEVLGVALFEKEGRGIRISHFGEVFLKHAGESLAAVQRGVDSLAQARASGGPPLRIGTLPTTSATFMPDALADFLAIGTGTHVTIVSGENRFLLDSLRLGELDLVVGRLAAPERMTGLIFEPLFSEEVAIIVSPDHPLAVRRNFTLGALANYTVLMPTAGSVIRPFVDRLLLTNGIPELPNTVETVSDSFGRAFVSRHRGVWFISRGVVADDLSSGRLVELEIDMGETRGAVGLTTPAGVEPSAALTLMKQTIRNHVEARNGRF
ncbi:pca operon transcription factor PcaQ [Rhizobium sp. S95]|uniref:Pca operon transcription factor PcaQ n=1 Tax=Ciceribacter sichuanensis TaxID=2949647 RepID=A0AAJ1BWZ6_9HYPH|nr:MULTISPECIES: pca operon transcription factor PcaQ [unclassified Ciceribacter]MCM2397133.1 pca operon transcription factor PcaQ [Ciceribacter sp. S95]MCO5957775.1 pca operon transcription factor PcaQ [Ciceribacter sp. S101]